VFSFVVLAFLLYNLLEGSWLMEPSFYELLGVDRQAEEQTLRLAFRQLAKRYHPDKVAKDVNRGDDVFIKVRDAFEALKNPVVRFAYDR
jgi:DnaJ-class molecular chaperone